MKRGDLLDFLPHFLLVSDMISKSSEYNPQAAMVKLI